MKDYTKDNVKGSKKFKSKHVKFLDTINDNGDLDRKVYKEVDIHTYKRTMKQGAQMTYLYEIEEILMDLKGDKEKQLFFYIIRQFKKNSIEVIFDQKRLAKKFDTSQPYVSRLIKKLLVHSLLMKVRSRPKSVYRLNPYIIIPSYVDGVNIQDEWDILNNAPKKVKDKFEYLSYLQSDDWRRISSNLKVKRGLKCEQCGSDKNLQTHHKTYDNLYDEAEEDLEVLCKSCHDGVHMEVSRATALSVDSGSGSGEGSSMNIIEYMDEESNMNINDISSYSVFSRGEEWKMKIWFRGETYKHLYKKRVLELSGSIEGRLADIAALEETIIANSKRLIEAKELKARAKAASKALKAS